MDKIIHGSEYNDDYLNWMLLPPFDSVKDLETFQDKIIEFKDAGQAYFTAIHHPHRRYLMQKVVLDKKDAKYAFVFALNVPNADIKALQSIVIESKKIKYITHFACFIKQADRKHLESIIIKSKNAKYAHMYLKHIKNANFNKLKQVIINSGKPRYLYELAKRLSSPEEISLIEDLIIQAKSFTYMRLMAEKIKLANLDKLEQAVLATNNAYEIKRFAQYVRKSKMKQFLLVM